MRILCTNTPSAWTGSPTPINVLGAWEALRGVAFFAGDKRLAWLFALHSSQLEVERVARSLKQE